MGPSLMIDTAKNPNCPKVSLTFDPVSNCSFTSEVFGPRVYCPAL